MNIIEKADRVFSLLIRHREKTHEGYVRCFTCGKILPVEEAQCGHFLSRQYKSTRFDERNVRVQCNTCNVHNYGQWDIFREELEDELGKEEVEELIRKAKNDPPPTEEELKEKIKEWRLQLKSLGVKI